MLRGSVAVGLPVLAALAGSTVTHDVTISAARGNFSNAEHHDQGG